MMLKWSEVISYLEHFEINIINKQMKYLIAINNLHVIIHIVRANSRDYFDITYLYQKLVYWKKIAVQIAISLKTF